MMDEEDHTILLDALRRLLAVGDLPPAVHATGVRFLRRLTTDIRVAIAGTDPEGCAYLMEMLAARNMAKTSFHLITENTAFTPDSIDICLWCTAAFDVEEARDWSLVPDRLKDHSFLVPVADPDVYGTAAHKSLLDCLEGIAAEDFYGLYPIVVPTPATPEQAKLTDTLLHEVEVMVQWGLSADADNAHVFVDIYGGRGGSKSRGVPLTRPISIARPAEHAPVTLSTFQQALDVLHGYNAPFEALSAATTPKELKEVLRLCATAAEAVADTLAGLSEGAPEDIQLRDDTRSAADRIFLMSMEGGAQPAVTAVTTLLHVRRILEAQCAA